MFGRLRQAWRRFLAARRQAGEITPQAFLDLSAELRELAETASKLRHSSPGLQGRLERILSEMEQLEDLASRPEFMRLSPAKRQELRQSLLSSRDQLISSMQTAAPPTDRLQ
ncbi:hypothetical protein [Desulfocurvus sp. DL9XJH121]